MDSSIAVSSHGLPRFEVVFLYVGTYISEETVPLFLPTLLLYPLRERAHQHLDRSCEDFLSDILVFGEFVGPRFFLEENGSHDLFF
jgi:hypothetical protein